MRKYLFAVLALVFCPTLASAGFFSTTNCDNIPAIQRVAYDTLCLQSTTVSGRAAGTQWVWDGAAWTSAIAGSVPGGAAGDVQYSSGGTFGGEAAFNYTAASDLLTAPSLNLTAAFALQGDITPTQITSDQNNYNPTGLSTAAVLRLDTDAPRNLTGLAGGADGRLLILYNKGSSSLTLVAASGLSTDLNRFDINSNITLSATQGIWLQYDSTSQRWRAASGISGGGGGGQAADDDLTALAGLVCTGLVTRTASNTFTCRTVTAGDGIGVATGSGVAGNPTIAVDSTVWRTTAGTASGGNHNFAAATSLTVPTAAGAAPTSDGRFAYDTTAEKYKGSQNSSTVTFVTEEYIAALDHSATNNRDVDSGSHPTLYWKFEDFAGVPPNGSCERVGQQQVNNLTGEPYGCIAAAGNPIPYSSFNISRQGATDGTYVATSTAGDTVQLGRAAGLATEWRVWSAKNGSGTTAFSNQPANDGIELISTSASDTGTCIVYGTTFGGDQSNVIMETVTLAGTSQAASVKADWGKIYVTQCSANMVGTLTGREASGNATIFTIIPGQSYAANAQTDFVKASQTLTQAIPISAGGMSVSGACYESEPSEKTPVASGKKRYTINPADDNTCSIEFEFPTPTNWDASTVTVKLIVMSTTNQNGEILALDFAGTALSSGDAEAAHSTIGERKATCTFGNSTNNLQMCTTSPAVTLNGTPAAGDLVIMRGQVDATTTTYTPTSAMSELHILGVVVTIGLL